MKNEIVTTTVAQPAPLPSAVPMFAQDLANVIGVGAAALIWGILWLRRRTSRDSTEMVKDRAESHILTVMQRERDQAVKDRDEAWSYRTSDAQAIARLQVEKQGLHDQLALAKDELFAEKLRTKNLRIALGRVAPDLASVLGSDFADLESDFPKD